MENAYRALIAFFITNEVVVINSEFAEEGYYATCKAPNGKIVYVHIDDKEAFIWNDNKESKLVDIDVLANYKTSLLADDQVPFDIEDWKKIFRP